VDRALPALKHLALELLAEAQRIAHQHDVLDAHVAIEEVESAPLEIHEQVVDAYDELLEIGHEIVARALDLFVDRVDARLVRREQLAARLDHPELFLRQGQDRLQRRRELDLYALLLREKAEDVILQGIE